MSESKFFAIDPTLEDYWRAAILFGKNVACYKFALGKSLLELATMGKTIITLDELAEPFSRHVVEHLQQCDTQNQASEKPYPFIQACRQFNKGEITKDKLIATTAQEAFKVVLDKFHNVNSQPLSVRFFDKTRGGITVTDELFRLAQTEQFQNFTQEVEARWRLVETAWELNISRNLIAVSYDPELKLLFTISDCNRRTDVTSCRDALNGYQKGKCFYSFADISIKPTQVNLTDVDHFLPHTLGKYGIQNLDGVWNLVLSSQNCNRGERGKFDRLPHIRYLERLHTRNEYLIKSNHPLKETLIWQTGVTEPARRKFLLSMYHTAQSKLGCPQDKTWQSEFEYSATF
ncbi:HNH endonuclease domain-containing protein [Nostoc sp. UIC 10630]|uniref:HNH endonuclease domain-containing protein n=1 Tax=Nostoc sp. UIC 10630 TaxID=2100146 RepID=UPI0013D18F1F|nr:HNH endonuclease domain-containing protein [Nostoc sp. UIC 10630]NEU77571.1 HNH endonuclease [Nostoc sp. UIC 10630]